jgi:hypothetical protein
MQAQPIAKHGKFVFYEDGECIQMQVLAGVASVEEIKQAEEIAMFLAMKGAGHC